jgi:signal transduction histidine kinase
MADETSHQSVQPPTGPAAVMPALAESAPVGRRVSMRLGLEVKLILSFMAVLCAAMGVTCLCFIQETHRRLADIMGEQARQVATSLALTSERLASTDDWEALNRRAQELIKGRSILFVGFLDSTGSPRTLASRDLEFTLANLQFNSQSLMQVNKRQLKSAGECLEVTVPIFSLPNLPGIAFSGERRLSGPKLLGYVSVGLSQAREEMEIYRVQYLVIGTTCAMVVLSMPMAWLLVRRIFLPIRKLVAVTQQIRSGNLDARAEINRPDVIGDLSRCFDDMTRWIIKQQNDLAAANRDLEHKVEQRTAQLEAANKRLSSEISEKDEFLRAVSHDLNAPLRNISGMVAMLLSKHREAFDEDVIYRLQRVQSNVDVEADLIGELLELSRIKTRRQTMEPVEVDRVIEELRAMLENDLKSKAISLIVDTALPVLSAEKMRVRQLFQNLIDNAIKYMGDSATREIHVGCRMLASEAEFYVSDTGIGIDPDELDKVFLIFRRGKNTVSQNIPGKGVGLASVKSIVETYSGTIGVTSQRGQGSEFRFTINGRFLHDGSRTPPSTVAAAA